MGNMRSVKRGMNKTAPEMEETGNNKMLAGAVGAENSQDIPPEDLKRIEGIKQMVMNFMYRKEAKAEIVKLLEGNDPSRTIPAASSMIYERLKSIAREKESKLDLETRLTIGLSAFGEVVEMAQAMNKLPEKIPEDMQESMLRKVIQDEIEKGLKSGEIDPIELQQKIEPLLPEDFKEEGQQIIQSTGAPSEPTQEMLRHNEKVKSERPLKAENEMLREQTQKQSTALRGLQNAVPSPQPGQPPMGQPQMGQPPVQGA